VVRLELRQAHSQIATAAWSAHRSGGCGRGGRTAPGPGRSAAAVSSGATRVNPRRRHPAKQRPNQGFPPPTEGHPADRRRAPVGPG